MGCITSFLGELLRMTLIYSEKKSKHQVHFEVEDGITKMRVNRLSTAIKEASPAREAICIKKILSCESLNAEITHSKADALPKREAMHGSQGAARSVNDAWGWQCRRRGGGESHGVARSFASELEMCLHRREMRQLGCVEAPRTRPKLSGMVGSTACRFQTQPIFLDVA
jgi:hypothetical protein